MLTPKQLDHFRSLLERERADILERIEQRGARIPSTVRAPDEQADILDEAAMLTDRDQAIAGNELDRDTLTRVERALERVRDGTYGTSEVSGRSIPLERLEAVPWASTLADETPPDD